MPTRKAPRRAPTPEDTAIARRDAEILAGFFNWLKTQPKPDTTDQQEAQAETAKETSHDQST